MGRLRRGCYSIYSAEAHDYFLLLLVFHIKQFQISLHLILLIKANKMFGNIKVMQPQPNMLERAWCNSRTEFK